MDRIRPRVHTGRPVNISGVKPRGLAPLADAPEQKFEDTTTTSTLPHTTTSNAASATTTPTTPPGTQPVTGDTAPQSNTPQSAIVPDPNATC